MQPQMLNHDSFFTVRRRNNYIRLIGNLIFYIKEKKIWRQQISDGRLISLSDVIYLLLSLKLSLREINFFSLAGGVLLLSSAPKVSVLKSIYTQIPTEIILALSTWPRFPLPLCLWCILSEIALSESNNYYTCHSSPFFIALIVPLSYLLYNRQSLFSSCYTTTTQRKSLHAHSKVTLAFYTLLHAIYQM